MGSYKDIVLTAPCAAGSYMTATKQNLDVGCEVPTSSNSPST